MKFKTLFFFLLLTGFISVRAQQPSPYFPNVGNNAVAQNINELKNPSVILMIALAPGFEDRATIAYYRIARGATVNVAYITNAEDVPSDFSGEMFYQLAARRKEEAYQALSLLGVQSFFLNIPIDEFSASDSNFHSSRNFFSALDSKLDTLITLVKPDVVVLNSDPLSFAEKVFPKGFSTRLAYLQHTLIAFSRGHVSTIKRIFVQTNEVKKTVHVPVERRNSLWKKTYLQIAKEAAACYKSLRFQIPLWERNERHDYRQVFPPAVKAPLFFDTGLPMFGPELKKLYPSIRRSFAVENEKSAPKRLKTIEAAIRNVDASIDQYEHTLNTSDLRILTAWKSRLENLRCVVLGINIPYSVSDSIVTPRQLFFFHIERLDTWMKDSTTQIVFPGTIEEDWVVNESQQSFYALNDSQTFRVLTPQKIQLTSTETTQGFSSLQNRTFFTFFIVHRDKNNIRNFIYRRQIPLIIAPFRSIEILTPQIATYRDSAVYVRVRSNVRDHSAGVMYISDSLVSSPKVKVSLPGKNYVVTDTVPLQWKDTLITSNHVVTLRAGGNLTIGSIVCRYLDVKSSAETKIGLYSVINNSPLYTALSRLGIKPEQLGSVQFTENNLSKLAVIVIDRFSAHSAFSSPRNITTLFQWVSNGGKLIMFPQYESEEKNPFLDDTINFSYLPLIGGNEAVQVDSADGVFETPNKIAANNFHGAMFPLSFGGLRGTFDNGMKVLMRSEAVHTPLLVERPMGKGSVYYCALNLFPRLLSLDETSYRLLANMTAK
jgi:hypothetical protein